MEESSRTEKHERMTEEMEEGQRELTQLENRAEDGGDRRQPFASVTPVVGDLLGHLAVL